MEKPLDSFENLRLLRLRERLMTYNIELHHIRGEKNQVADFMSRYPLHPAEAELDDGELLYC